MAEKNYPSFVKKWISNVKTAFMKRGIDPNDIITKDLLHYSSGQSGQLGTNTNLSMTSNKVLGKLLSVFNNHISGKQEVLYQSRQLFDTDIVQTIIDVVINDAFNSFVDIDNEFKIEYNPQDSVSEEFKDEVQSHIDHFVNKFDLKNQIADMVPELLRDGEFAFGIITQPNKGIVDIVDDLDVANLLPFYNGNKLSFIMKRPESNQISQKPLVYRSDNIVYFRLKYFTKERVDLTINGVENNNQIRKKFYDETKLYLPRFIRICKPFYYSALKLIARLGVLELVGTVQELNQVTRRDIININVPQNTSPREANTIISDYEKILNGPDNELGVDLDSSKLDVNTLATYNTKRIILPQWSDGKGTLSLSDVNSGSNDKSAGARESISFVRSLIALSVGIPGFYVSLSEQGLDKTQTLKLYTRYVRKLTALQKSISDGTIDFIQAHLKSLNIFVEDSSLKCRFKTLTSADSLDETDITVGTIEGLNNIFKNLIEIEDSKPDLKVSSEVFKKIFDTHTNKYLGFTDLLQYVENIEPSDEFVSDNDSNNFDDDSDFESDFENQVSSDAYDDFSNSSLDAELDDFEPIEVETDIGPEASPNEENNIENVEGE